MLAQPIQPANEPLKEASADLMGQVPERNFSGRHRPLAFLSAQFVQAKFDAQS
jgi:hypothetical protein